MTDTISGYLEPEEVHAIVNAIPEVSKHPERDELLFNTLWQTGGRITEVITMTPEQVGMSSVRIRNLKQRKVLKEDGKVKYDKDGKPIKISDKNADKEVEVSRQLCAELKAFCDAHHIPKGDYIFKSNTNEMKHLSRWYCWWLLNKASEKARVYRFGKRNPRSHGGIKGAWPHLLRHSNAMLLLEKTKDISLVQQQLGHSSVRTTQTYAYTKKPEIKKQISEIEW
jgi:integrase/recombinase XerD